jgi:hypothetical protein
LDNRDKKPKIGNEVYDKKDEIFAENRFEAEC